jgi:DNA-binding response OmpR family regulator
MTEQQANPRIVIVEDHDALRESLVSFLSASGYSVFGFSCAEELDEHLSTAECEIFILDVQLPGENGFDIAKRMRFSHTNAFIVMLTVLNEERHKVQGYVMADTYLPKPVSGKELLAVVNSLTRRLQGEGFRRKIVELDLFNSKLQYNKKHVLLNLQERALLKALVEAPEGRVPSWRLMEILDVLQAGEVDKSYLEMQVFRLRKKLSDIGAPYPMIKTERGHGYRILHEVELHRS